MFKDISVWQCCRKQGQNYLNVGRGGGEYICTQGGKIGSFSTLVHLFRLRLYLKHWGINLPVCIQRENAEKHSNVISVTERTEEFTELVLDTVCPSVCLSVAESHGERCVCVCMHFSTTERKRPPAAQLWQRWATKLPEPCAWRCHGNRGLQDWYTRVRARRYACAHTHAHFSPPHTFTQQSSSRTMQLEYRRTEERHYTTLAEYRRCQEREENGGRRGQQGREGGEREKGKGMKPHHHLL